MTDKEQKYKKLANINSDRHDHEQVIKPDEDHTFDSDEEEFGAGSAKGEDRTKRGRWDKKGRTIDF